MYSTTLDHLPHCNHTQTTLFTTQLSPAGFNQQYIQALPPVARRPQARLEALSQPPPLTNWEETDGKPITKEGGDRSVVCACVCGCVNTNHPLPNKEKIFRPLFIVTNLDVIS